MSSSGAPADPGLQPERTLLAWRRTCLALAVASAVIVRFGSESIGAFAAVLGIVGIATAASAYIVSARRYSTAHRSIAHDEELAPDGLALALVTLTLLLICVGAISYVVGVGAQRLAVG
ncbi:DUF202 domain-containing protein [Microbacterium lacus]|uniref:DUF202 domain-containing protein n=1 Tax=Microbacterium lacus TaxID=415217 RepID=UPI00384D995C